MKGWARLNGRFALVQQRLVRALRTKGPSFVPVQPRMHCALRTHGSFVVHPFGALRSTIFPSINHNQDETLMDEPCTEPCICPHCLQEMQPILPAAWWAPLRCTSCGKPIESIHFDRAASRINDSLVMASDRLGALKKIGSGFALASKAWGAPASSLFEFADRFILQPRIEALSGTVSKQQGQLTSLTDARYELSAWHRCSKMPLLPTERTGDPQSKLTGSYRKDGHFHLAGNDGKTAGIAGEFVAFEQLIAASRCAHASMMDARICQDLYLPLHDHPDGKMKGETDIVILTRSLAIVCEVKRWRCSVQYTPHLQTILTRRSGETASTLDGYKDDSKPLEQAQARWKDFKALGLYPDDRVLYALCFVNPTEFEAPVNAFINSCLVSCCCESAESPFIAALNDELAKREPIFEQSEVDAMALDIQAEYGDSDGAEARAQRLRYKEPARKARMESKSHEPLFLPSNPSPQAALRQAKRRGPKRKAFQQNRSQSKSHKRNRQRMKEDFQIEEWQEHDETIY